MLYKSLNAVTSTGAGSSNDYSGLVMYHTVQVTYTGSPTAVTVDLEGTLDGTTWFQLATHPADAGEITANGFMFHVIDRVVLATRANLTTLTGGTAPTVTGFVAGMTR
jgi:predicted RNA-binding protein YlqC (UPF0109 family)